MSQTWITAVNLFASVASILGLCFSFQAWRRARGAEQAAKEAREAVRQGNAAEDLQDVAAMAKEFLACVQQDRIGEACLRARDLVAGVSHARQRWQVFLPQESRQRLGQTVNRVGSVSRALSRRAGQITPADKDKILRVCHEVVVTLAEEGGKMLLLIQRRED